MDKWLRPVIGAIALGALGATTIGLLAAQAPQNPPAVSGARNFVVIGCLSREGQASAGGRGGGAGSGDIYITTDRRANPPARYRVDGDPEQLKLHVGHTVEIAGPVTPPPTARGGAANMALPTLKVQSLTYISTTCAK